MTAPVQNTADTGSARCSTPDEDEARRAVAAAVEMYRLGFLRLDPEQLASMWDRQHEPLIYVAQERDEPIHGWAAIQLYFAGLPEHLDRVLSKELEDVKIDVVGDTAIVFFTSRSSVMLKGRPTKYEPLSHISMIFRRTSDGWRAVHFHESARSAQAERAMKAMQGKPTRP
jgi:ketosteroid isomerase-like protein